MKTFTPSFVLLCLFSGGTGVRGGQEAALAMLGGEGRLELGRAVDGGGSPRLGPGKHGVVRASDKVARQRCTAGGGPLRPSPDIRERPEGVLFSPLWRAGRETDHLQQNLRKSDATTALKCFEIFTASSSTGCTRFCTLRRRRWRSGCCFS